MTNNKETINTPEQYHKAVALMAFNILRSRNINASQPLVDALILDLTNEFIPVEEIYFSACHCDNFEVFINGMRFLNSRNEGVA